MNGPRTDMDTSPLRLPPARTDANLDERGRDLGVTLWHAMVLVDPLVASASPGGYASVWATARNQRQMEDLVRGAIAQSETWSYDGIDWTLLLRSTAAPFPSAMAYDLQRSTAVLFNGTDTWAFANNAWHRSNTATVPPSGGSLAYDPRLGCVVLAGRELWLWDGTDWSSIATLTNPWLISGATTRKATRAQAASTLSNQKCMDPPKPVLPTSCSRAWSRCSA